MSQTVLPPVGQRLDRPAPVAPQDRASVNSAGRLEFLDALRGLSALAVAAHHAFANVYPAYGNWSGAYFATGTFGVVAFFVCSGFIIPASLERQGSLRRFWISRFFRLYPLYWVCLIACAVLVAYRPVFALGRGNTGYQWWLEATMVSGSLGGHSLAVRPAWTLLFEMFFYVLCSYLFVIGAHRRSVASAGVATGVALAVGVLIPGNAVTGGSGYWWLLWPAGAALTAGLAWRYAPSRLSLRVTALLLGPLLVFLLLNRNGPWFLVAYFLGVMFLGTAYYRWTRGEVRGRTVAWLTVGVCVAGVVGNSLYSERGPAWFGEATAIIAGVLFFCVMLLQRHRRFPRVLTYLGTVSYSVYLVHMVVYYAIQPLESQPLTVTVWLGAGLAASLATYYLVEKPGQRLGRWVARRWVPRSVRAAR